MSDGLAAPATTFERPDLFDLRLPASELAGLARPERLRELADAAGVLCDGGLWRFGQPEAPERLLLVFDQRAYTALALAGALAGLAQRGRRTALVRQRAVIGIAAGLAPAELRTAIEALAPTLVVCGALASPADQELFAGAGAALVEHLYLSPPLQRALWARAADVWRPVRWLGRPTFRRAEALLRRHPDYRLGLLARLHALEKGIALFGEREHMLHAAHPEALPGWLPIGEGRFCAGPLAAFAGPANAAALGLHRVGAAGITVVSFRAAPDECIAAWLAVAEGALLARLEHRDEPARREKREAE